MSASSLRGLCLALITLIALAGCAPVETRRVHHSLGAESSRPLPQRAVLLPLDVRAFELSAGGVTEEVPAWSDQARQNLERKLESIGSRASPVEISPLAELTPLEQRTLEEHVALYDVVSTQAYLLTQSNDPAWAHKKTRFDYSLGPGLAFLRGRTGADSALIVTAADVISSTERKTTAFVAALFGVGIPMGYSYVSVGLVDLATGDLLWSDKAISYANRDLREPSDAAAMLDEVFVGYPRSGKVPATPK